LLFLFPAISFFVGCASQLYKLGNLLFDVPHPAIGCPPQNFCMDAVKCLSILFKRMNGFDGFPSLNAKSGPKKRSRAKKYSNSSHKMPQNCSEIIKIACPQTTSTLVGCFLLLFRCFFDAFWLLSMNAASLLAGPFGPHLLICKVNCLGGFGESV